VSLAVSLDGLLCETRERWRALLPQDIMAMFWKTCISACLLRRGERKYMLSNPCDGCLEVYFQHRANVQVFTVFPVFLYTLLPLMIDPVKSLKGPLRNPDGQQHQALSKPSTLNLPTTYYSSGRGHIVTSYST
jgi:hypothetical protein